MNIGSTISTWLNLLEDFTKKRSFIYFPLKMICWSILILALILTNLIAVMKWPFSSIRKIIIGQSNHSPTLLDIQDEEELDEIIKSNKVVLIDFWAQWCGPCLLMNKTIERISKSYSSELIIAKVDMSLGGKKYKSFNVSGLPTFIVYDNGVERSRKAGALSETQLMSFIEKRDS